MKYLKWGTNSYGS